MMQNTLTPTRTSKGDPFAVVYAYVKGRRPYESRPYEMLSREVPKDVVLALAQLSAGQRKRLTARGGWKPGWVEEVIARRGMREDVLRQFPHILQGPLGQ